MDGGTPAGNKPIFSLLNPTHGLKSRGTPAGATVKQKTTYATLWGFRLPYYTPANVFALARAPLAYWGIPRPYFGGRVLAGEARSEKKYCLINCCM